MKNFKKISKLLIFVLMFSVLSPSALPFSYVVKAQAATIKITQKSLTLEVGKTAILKVTGTKNKVTWSSSNKTIATVDQKGKIKAIKAGEATITATVNKKKYSCKVTVVKPINPYVANAPFDAKEYSFKDVSVVYPKNWIFNLFSEQENSVIAILYSPNANLTNTSSITLVISQSNASAPDYSTVKEILSKRHTPEYFQEQMANAGLDATITNLIQSDFEIELGTAFKTEYTVTMKTTDGDISFKQTLYDFYINEYLVEVTVSDLGDNLAPDLYSNAEYMLNSIQINK